jgi:hypothetical protein
MEQGAMEQGAMQQGATEQGQMEHGLEAVVSQIKKTYTYGGLYNYLNTASRPDIDVIMEYLRAIEEGDDLYHRDDKAQLNAYSLLCRLNMLRENKRFYFSS